MSLYEALPEDTFLSKRTFAWAFATQYRISLIRSGNSYACAFAFAGGMTQTTNGSTPKVVALSKASVNVYGANARAAWILVVSSP